MAIKTKVAGGAAILAAIAMFITPFEGTKTKAYRDPVGIMTICTGETQGVYAGETKTKQECEAMLIKRIPDYLGPVDKMMPGLPDNRRIAYTDFSYNLGPGALGWRTWYCTLPGKSGAACPKKYRHDIPGTSVVDLEKSGKWENACARLLLFDTAGGKKLKGLTIRRNKEYKTCIGK